jgi:plasmid stabilization system protein ParE
MRVEYTPEAASNLDTILFGLLQENPVVAFALAETIDRTVRRIAAFPESSPAVAFGESVRVASLVRYPYRIFYRVRPDVVEILHIRHTSRAPLPGGR